MPAAVLNTQQYFIKDEPYYVPIGAGIAPVTACHTAIAQTLTDDHEMLVAVNKLSSSLF